MLRLTFLILCSLLSCTQEEIKTNTNEPAIGVKIPFEKFNEIFNSSPNDSLKAQEVSLKLTEKIQLIFKSRNTFFQHYGGWNANQDFYMMEDYADLNVKVLEEIKEAINDIHPDSKVKLTRADNLLILITAQKIYFSSYP